MKTVFINIIVEICNALKKTNGAVGWRVLAGMVADGPGGVQPVNCMGIVEFMMSTDETQYTATK